MHIQAGSLLDQDEGERLPIARRVAVASDWAAATLQRRHVLAAAGVLEVHMLPAGVRELDVEQRPQAGNVGGGDVKVAVAAGTHVALGGLAEEGHLAVADGHEELIVFLRWQVEGDGFNGRQEWKR